MATSPAKRVSPVWGALNRPEITSLWRYKSQNIGSIDKTYLEDSLQLN